MSATTLAPAALSGAELARARHRRGRRRLAVTLGLAGAIAGLFVLALCLGEQTFSPAEVLRVLGGERLDGSFPIAHLRLPRALTAVLAGLAFGLAGVTFQLLLRNPLASPDIIGISSGASAAAVFGVTVLGLSGLSLTGLALLGGLGTALAIYLLARRGSLLGSRLILIGIGLAAMLLAAINWLLARANQWDVVGALRWLSGSLNSAFWQNLPPLLLGLALLLPLLFASARVLPLLQLGDDTAAGLGVNVARARISLLLLATALAALATASTGPIAFVALLSGPIAARVLRSSTGVLLPAGLTGALLVIGADLVSQHLAPVNYPVGVITGLVGAPYLLYLLVRSNRRGGSL